MIKPEKLMSAENELLEYFTGAKHQGSGALNGLDMEDVEFLEGVLKTWCLSDCVEIDRTKLGDSHEAWVHVLITGDEQGSGLGEFCGFGPYPRPAILTWTNSN